MRWMVIVGMFAFAGCGGGDDKPAPGQAEAVCQRHCDCLAASGQGSPGCERGCLDDAEEDTKACLTCFQELDTCSEVLDEDSCVYICSLPETDDETIDDEPGDQPGGDESDDQNDNIDSTDSWDGVEEIDAGTPDAPAAE